MGGHRGDAVLKRLSSHGLREIGIACVVGTVFATVWWSGVKSKNREFDRVHAFHEMELKYKKQQFEKYMESAPFDDEIEAAMAAASEDKAE